MAQVRTYHSECMSQVVALFLFLACAQLNGIGRARRCPFASQRLVSSNNITDKFTLWSIATHLVPLHVVFADHHLVLWCRVVACSFFVWKKNHAPPPDLPSSLFKTLNISPKCVGLNILLYWNKHLHLYIHQKEGTLPKILNKYRFTSKPAS